MVLLVLVSHSKKCVKILSRMATQWCSGWCFSSLILYLYLQFVGFLDQIDIEITFDKSSRTSDNCWSKNSISITWSVNIYMFFLKWEAWIKLNKNRLWNIRFKRLKNLSVIKLVTIVNEQRYTSDIHKR